MKNAQRSKSDATFDEYKKALNEEVAARFGLEYDDLPDVASCADAYEAGTPVGEFIEEDLAEALGRFDGNDEWYEVLRGA